MSIACVEGMVNVAFFLLSDKASRININGVILPVDGGLTAQL